MRKGDTINEYVILKDFELSGLSKWTFAEKNGIQYFIKEFLSPIFPTIGSLGNEQTKQNKINKCFAFEKRQIEIISKLASNFNNSNKIVCAKDFFRYGSKYYKVTDKIDCKSYNTLDISLLPLIQKINLLLDLVYTLKFVHNLGIVHSDIRPENILIIENNQNLIVRLIDFDNSFFSTKPPLVNELFGDMIYYSPEIYQYIKLEGNYNTQRITTKSDIFSLGIIFSQYLTGILPEPIYEGKSAADMVYNQKTIGLPENFDLPSALHSLVKLMLDFNPEKRPDLSSIQNELTTIKNDITMNVQEVKISLSTDITNELQKRDFALDKIKEQIINYQLENKKLINRIYELEKIVANEKGLKEQLKISNTFSNSPNQEFQLLKRDWINKLAKAKIEDVVSNIIEFANQYKIKDLLTNIIHISSRWTNLKNNKNIGILSQENIELETNKIHKSIIDLLFNFDENER